MIVLIFDQPWVSSTFPFHLPLGCLPFRTLDGFLEMLATGPAHRKEYLLNSFFWDIAIHSRVGSLNTFQFSVHIVLT